LIPILSDEQVRQLADLRDHSPKPYLRERAAAILKLAQGLPASQIATQGLPRRRYYETVTAWFHRFEEHGFDGLHIRSGRGRKPAFSASPHRH
jgi:transposase